VQGNGGPGGGGADLEDSVENAGLIGAAQRVEHYETAAFVSTFLALVRKVFRNRFCCHGQSLAELAPSKLSNFGHSLTIHGPRWRVGKSLSAKRQRCARSALVKVRWCLGSAGGANAPIGR
jgi:hypothetical protein